MIPKIRPKVNGGSAANLTLYDTNTRFAAQKPHIDSGGCRGLRPRRRNVQSVIGCIRIEAMRPVPLCITPLRFGVDEPVSCLLDRQQGIRFLPDGDRPMFCRTTLDLLRIQRQRYADTQVSVSSLVGGLRNRRAGHQHSLTLTRLALIRQRWHQTAPTKKKQIL